MGDHQALGAAVQHAGVTERIGYISTAGGAFLEFLEGRVLPGVAALDEEVLAMVQRAQPLPAFPSAMMQQSVNLVVPIRFSLR